MPIDTMCSSSLVAVHEACEHLRRDECEVAIAGGVNLSLHPHMYVSLSAQRMLSSDGRCKSFGKGGNGYVPGEGVGVIFLKPLAKALADHDRIYALIRATSVNHGGKTNGYTVPNPLAQAQVVEQALRKARISARAVSYIEAHGTGTELGDPIEITGLTRAFRRDTTENGFCALGSVKSNIGHLEAASGIAGLTKVILQMRNKTLVPSLHAEELNQNIDFAGTPFFVNRELRAWEQPILDGTVCPRIAGVSSFGAAGTNAHVIVEEYAESPRPPQPRPVQVKPVAIVLSASRRELLNEYARSLLDLIRDPVARAAGGIDLVALAYTLQVGREAMDERLGVVVHSVEELEVKLQQFIDGVQGIENLRVGKAMRNGHHVERD
jgi:polyketide synthase PksN